MSKYFLHGDADFARASSANIHPENIFDGMIELSLFPDDLLVPIKFSTLKPAYPLPPVKVYMHKQLQNHKIFC